MRIGRGHVAATFASLLVGGTLIAWLGVIDIRASSGHWRITDWFLHWVMRSSVRTAAFGVDPPHLGNPAYLPLAAGHYELACADCHGSPERPRSPTVLRMLPPPPDLKNVVGTWSDAELFEIVKHGVRYTGMPAWPANRNDEVWAMVAFLRQYEGLNGTTYRRLRGGSEQGPGVAADALLTGCDGCHASGRLDDESLSPRLDGQSETYLVESLKAFRAGQRPSGVMQTAASGLDDEEIARLARAYASRPAERRPSSGMYALVTLGDASRKIPACGTCHDKAGLNPTFPTLRGLGASYVRNQLRLFKSGLRGGTQYSVIMTRAAQSLTENDIDALADYYRVK